LLYRHTNHVGISAKAGHGDHVSPEPALVDTKADSIDPIADLVAGHDRNGRQIRIYAHASHDVGEIDPARLDADADLAGLGRWIGGLFDLQHFRRAGACNPNLSHGDDPPRLGVLNQWAAFNLRPYLQSSNFREPDLGK
jgi:hypothetical protein